MQTGLVCWTGFEKPKVGVGRVKNSNLLFARNALLIRMAAAARAVRVHTLSDVLLLITGTLLRSLLISQHLVVAGGESRNPAERDSEHPDLGPQGAPADLRQVLAVVRLAGSLHRKTSRQVQICSRVAIGESDVCAATDNGRESQITRTFMLKRRRMYIPKTQTICPHC